MDDDRILRIIREFEAKPDDVYNAWVNPEILVQWWGPEGMTTPEYDLNIHEGGSWTTTMESSNGDRVTVSGVYKILQPPDRLVFSWAWNEPDGSRGFETEVEVCLAASGTGTLMTLTQGPFENAKSRNNHNFGWTSSFNDLEKILG